MFPAGLPNLEVFDFTPEKNVYILTHSAAVPWTRLCASANTRSFLEAPPFVCEDFFSANWKVHFFKTFQWLYCYTRDGCNSPKTDDECHSGGTPITGESYTTELS